MFGVVFFWGIVVIFVYLGEKVVLIFGDGGFLFFVMELEIVVCLCVLFVYFVWNDGSYDMVVF